LALQIVSRKKCRQKLPTWFSKLGILYPPTLHIEQSSSELTAQYKASLIDGQALMDITGGFGVDTYYFSKKFEKVIYCERNTELTTLVAHNLKLLKRTNITIRNVDGIHSMEELDNKIDWIYLDPSRRTTTQKKVFLLEDCDPDVTSLSNTLLKKAKGVLLKTSPMLDISSALKVLKEVSNIHLVAVNNEVKELLFLIQSSKASHVKITTVNILNGSEQFFSFNYPDSVTATLSAPQKFLYEPNTAILKAGAFNSIANRLKVFKLHKHSHLYTSESYLKFPGRRFEITEVIPFNKKVIKKKYANTKGNITTRNFPESVDRIRKLTGIKDGGEFFFFFTTNNIDKPIVIVCKKV
jgi:16S rRNA G966 N2-methylase RsmD